MSWGIEITGVKDAVAAKFAADMDKVAAMYVGKEEGKDIVAVKERGLALIDALAMGEEHGYTWNAVKVSASGSHGLSGGGLTSASFRLDVTRLSLAL